MELSFRNIKNKLVAKLSSKLSKKQVEDAFEIIKEDIHKEFKAREIKKQKSLEEFMTSDDYANMKNLSFWIFNTYGIPDDNKCVFTTYLGQGSVLAENTNNKDKLHKTLKSGILGKAYQQIISEYLTEYTGEYVDYDEDLFLSDSLSKTESIFIKVDKQLYPNYKFAGEVISNDWSEIRDKFIDFKSSEDNLVSEKGLKALKYAKEKRKLYYKTHGDKYQAKLVTPISALVFDSINEERIDSDAESWDLSKEKLLSKVKECLDIVKSNGFITVEAVYNSDYLMEFVLFRKAWYFLSSDNEPIIVDMIDPNRNNKPTYYGSEAEEKNGRNP
jgi:hypothetical protein